MQWPPGHLSSGISAYMFLNVDEMIDIIYEYHLLKNHTFYFTGGHYHPKSLGNLMIMILMGILTKSIMSIVHLGPPVILVII